MPENAENSGPTLSNFWTFREIAEEAQSKSERILGRQQKPKPNGEVGRIITYDPKRRSLKHALTAIIFAGTFLDALIYIEGCRRIGKGAFKKVEKRRMPYRAKLKVAGILDETTLDACKRLRDARNDLVHEKPIQLVSGRNVKMRWAQDEARHAIEVIRILSKLFGYEG